jgi:hypothetical protein
MIRFDAPHDSVSNEEDAESRAFRRIAEALERDDIDELAAALGQDPDPAWSSAESHGDRTTTQDGPRKRASFWSGLRRLTARLQPRRPA